MDLAQELDDKELIRIAESAGSVMNYEVDLAEFLTRYNIQPGKYNITAYDLYYFYKDRVEEPMRKWEFFKASSKVFTKRGFARKYKVNFKLTPEEKLRIKELKRVEKANKTRKKNNRPRIKLWAQRKALSGAGQVGEQ